MTRNNWLMFVVAAASGSVLTYGRISHAFDRRQSAAFCAQVTGSMYMSMQATVESNSSSGSAYVVCPIIDDDLMRYWQVAQVNVHGRDDSTGAQAGVQACSSPMNFDQTQERCGAQATSGIGFVGEFTLNPDLTEWRQNVTDYPYLYVVLPPHASSLSELRGYWYFN